MFAQTHPFFTAFPIALLSAAVLFELLALGFKRHRGALRVASFANLLLLIPLALLALFSGYSAGDVASVTFKVPESALAAHQFWGRMLVFSLIPLIIVRSVIALNSSVVMLWVLYWSLLLGCWALCLWTGSLGGQLVFEHGAGVRAEIQVELPG